MFTVFYLFCVKHSSWGERPLLSLKRSSEDSQREKFLLHCRDKSPSLLFCDIQSRSGDRLQEICYQLQLFSLAMEVFDQEKKSSLKSPAILPLHFQSAQRWHHFSLYLIPVLETCVPNFIPSWCLSGTVWNPSPCEEQDNLDCKVMNGDLWPSLLLYTLSPTLLLQTDDCDKVGRLFKVSLECKHSSPLGTRNLACLKHSSALQKLSSVRTWSKSCWKQEHLCWACRLTRLFH